MGGPGRTARVMLVAGMMAACYLDFFAYKQGGFDDRHVLEARLLGHSPAPEQYRLGLYAAAQQMVLRLHIAPTMALAVIDGVTGILAMLALFGVLERSAVYARAQRSVQWFGAATFVLLAAWFTGWLLWLQKPETLPAAALVAAMLWLWEAQASTIPTSLRQGARPPGWLWRAVALVGLNLLLATFRADLACLLNAGILAYVLMRREVLSLPRPAALTTAALAALSAGGVQLWLMRVAFPDANYGRVKMWQLWPNVKHGTRWPPFVIFLLPLLWLAVQAVRRGLPKDTAGRAFFAGAVVYAALWVAIGKIDEVRIFLPLALALTPLTVQTAMQHVERHA